MAPTNFYDAFRAQPPDQRDGAGLERLLAALQKALERGTQPPPDAPPAPAIEQALRAAVTTKLPPPWHAYLEYLLASNACMLGDLAAIDRAARALEQLARSAPELTDYATPRALLLADLQRALGDFAPALAGVQRLLRDPQLPADPALHSDALGLCSEILRETGRLDEAAALVAESLDRAKASGSPEAIEKALVRDQAMALATGRFLASRKVIEQHLATVDAKDTATRALLLVYRGYAESGAAETDPQMLSAAKATLDEARQLAKGHLQVRADLKRVDLALRAADVAAAGAALADCEHSLGPLPAQDPLPRDQSERISLVTRFLLLRKAPPAELRAWLPTQRRAQQALADEWQRQPPSRGGIGFLQLGQRRELLACGIALELSLAAAEQRTDGAARALQILVDLQAETSLARARGAAPCQVAALQRDLLGGNRGALVFLPSRQTTYAFYVDGKDVACFELCGYGTLAKACSTAAGRLARSPVAAGPERTLRNEALRTSLRAAAQQLLPAPLLARVLPLDGLTVVGADLLGGLPLETLLLEDGRLLGEVVPIDNTGSLPLALALTRSAPPASRGQAKVLVAGCTEVAAPSTAGVENFTFPAAELQPGLSQLPGATVLCDAQVTRGTLLGTRLQDYDIVHVIAHHVPGTGPTGAGRLVVHDGFVERADLDGHAVHGLAIVSACGGGQGPLRSGEGDAFTSVAGSFLWNGATAVIASRNELLVLDHLRLMQRVYAGLAAHATPARALRDARQAMAPDSDLLQRTNRAVVQVFGAGHVAVLRP